MSESVPDLSLDDGVLGNAGKDGGVKGIDRIGVDVPVAQIPR